jgi:hypothetical protein
MSEGEARATERSEAEELYTVRLTIYPRSVSGLPRSPQDQEGDKRTEAELLAGLQTKRASLHAAFQAEADKAWAGQGAEMPEEEPNVRLAMRDLRIQSGSITLIAILGVVYIGVKDYEQIRQSLLLMARDMRSRLRDFLSATTPNFYRHYWAIDSEVMVGTPSSQPQSARASRETHTYEPTPAMQSPSPFNWDARTAFGLYLAITNIVLIVILGLLLIRAYP